MKRVLVYVFIVFKRLSILVKLGMVGVTGAGHKIEMWTGFENRICGPFHRKNTPGRGLRQNRVVFRSPCGPFLRLGGPIQTPVFEACWLMLSVLSSSFYRCRAWGPATHAGHFTDLFLKEAGCANIQLYLRGML